MEMHLFESKFKTYLKATGVYLKEKFDSLRPYNKTLLKGDEMLEKTLKEQDKLLSGLDYDLENIDLSNAKAGTIHSKVGAIQVNNHKTVLKAFTYETIENVGTWGIGKGIGPRIDSLPVGEVKKTLLKKLAPKPIYKGAEEGVKAANNKIRGPEQIKKK